MNGWAAFGFGILAGALLFDQLWRHVRRLEKRLASLRGEIGYYTQADIDAAWERVRSFDFKPTDAELAASADTHPKDGDALAAPLVSGAVPQGDAPNTAAQKDSPDV